MEVEEEEEEEEEVGDGTGKRDVEILITLDDTAAATEMAEVSIKRSG